MKSKDSIYNGVMAFRLENTKYVIRYTKKHEELLARLLKAGKDGIQEEAFKWARQHNEEFGNRFILELYDVFWNKVWYSIQPTSKSKFWE